MKKVLTVAAVAEVATGMALLIAKPIGVGAASQPWILAGERSGLLTRIVAMGSGSQCGADEKLTAFAELESAIESVGLLMSAFR
jgi:hypothetical protein